MFVPTGLEIGNAQWKSLRFCFQACIIYGSLSLANIKRWAGRNRKELTRFMFPDALLRPKIKRRSSEESGGSNLVIDFNNRQIKQEMSPYSSGTNTSGTLNTSSEGTSLLSGSGGTSCPKPVVRRRVRRRANSSSQDPAEQLTEMSVRGKCSTVFLFKNWILASLS